MNEVRYFLNAGIDFGTSYTKVYVEDQFTELRKPVLFGEEKSGLLPSFLRCAGNQIHGPLDGSEGIRIPYPKLFLVDQICESDEYKDLYGVEEFDPPSAKALVTAYLARLIGHIEEFLAADPDWKDFSLDRDLLSLQVAVPTGLLAQDSVIEEATLECLKAAVLITRNRESVLSIDSIQEVLDSLPDLPDPEQNFLNKSCRHYPEVAAAVQAMLRKKDLPPGKYITMDVGAGTVDLNFFFKREDDENEEEASVDNWVAKVVPLGCAHLGAAHAGAGDHEPGGAGLDEATLTAELSESIKDLMHQVFVLQPRRVAGDGPDVFHHGVHAYVLGGGANVPVYPKILKETLDELDVKVSQIMRLPRPDLDFVPPGGVDDFGRLAVAYGISSPPENLRTTRLPQEMAAVLAAALKRAKSERRRGEMLCSCYSNPDCSICGGNGFIRDRGVQPNLDAIALWNSRREIVLSKSKDPGRYSALPEVGKLSKLIDGLPRLLEAGRIVQSYLVIKEMELLRRMVPHSHCKHIRIDARNAIDKALRWRREEEVGVDFATLREITDGLEARIEYSGYKRREQKLLSCVCTKLPSADQDGLITRCFASLKSSKCQPALYVRFEEEDEPPPKHDDDLDELRDRLGRFTQGR